MSEQGWVAMAWVRRSGLNDRTWVAYQAAARLPMVVGFDSPAAGPLTVVKAWCLSLVAEGAPNVRWRHADEHVWILEVHR
jgi:hypothetical protein